MPKIKSIRKIKHKDSKYKFLYLKKDECVDCGEYDRKKYRSIVLTVAYHNSKSREKKWQHKLEGNKIWVCRVK